MTISFRRSAIAIGLLGSVAFIPLPSYALDDDDAVIEAPDATVEIERDRPGILPRLRDDPDVYVEDDDDDEDVPPGASVEVDPD
jgi:hypothetical protein